MVQTKIVRREKKEVMEKKIFPKKDLLDLAFAEEYTKRLLIDEYVERRVSDAIVQDLSHSLLDGIELTATRLAEVTMRRLLNDISKEIAETLK